MSATLRVYTRVVVEQGGTIVLDAGSVLAPHNEVTIEGAYMRQQTATIGPGETVTIYQYADNPTFQIMAVWVRAGGFVDVGVQGDSPVGGGDVSASGLSRVWNHTPVSDAAPWVLCSPAALVNTDPADHAEQSGNTAGFFVDAQETRGSVYTVQVKVPDDATDDVTIDYIVIA